MQNVDEWKGKSKCKALNRIDGKVGNRAEQDGEVDAGTHGAENEWQEHQEFDWANGIISSCRQFVLFSWLSTSWISQEKQVTNEEQNASHHGDVHSFSGEFNKQSWYESEQGQWDVDGNLWLSSFSLISLHELIPISVVIHEKGICVVYHTMPSQMEAGKGQNHEIVWSLDRLNSTSKSPDNFFGWINPTVCSVLWCNVNLTVNSSLTFVNELVGNSATDLWFSKGWVILEEELLLIISTEVNKSHHNQSNITCNSKFPFDLFKLIEFENTALKSDFVFWDDETGPVVKEASKCHWCNQSEEHSKDKWKTELALEPLRKHNNLAHQGRWVT